MKNTTVIAKTNKGHRVFLEGVTGATQRPVGQRYDVVYLADTIHIIWSQEGKRKVVASKGGVIDLEGKKVSQWAKGADNVDITVNGAQIIITRGA